MFFCENNLEKLKKLFFGEKIELPTVLVAMTGYRKSSCLAFVDIKVRTVNRLMFVVTFIADATWCDFL